MAKKTSFFGKIMGGNVTEEAQAVAVSRAPLPEEEEMEARRKQMRLAHFSFPPGPSN